MNGTGEIIKPRKENRRLILGLVSQFFPELYPLVFLCLLHFITYCLHLYIHHSSTLVPIVCEEGFFIIGSSDGLSLMSKSHLCLAPFRCPELSISCQTTLCVNEWPSCPIYATKTNYIHQWMSCGVMGKGGLHCSLGLHLGEHLLMSIHVSVHLHHSQ